MGMSWWTPRLAAEPVRLQLGTMNFGKRTPEADSVRVIRRAIERGVTFFDTANAYVDGESERIVGRAVAKERDQVILATKVGFGRIAGKPEGLGRARILAACDESLKRLGTDRVDLYYLHVPDPRTPLAESLDALAELLEKKKILHWGVSNYASWQILEMMHLADARKMPRPVMSQQIYNVLIRQLDIEYFKFTAAHPLATTVYNPLAGGILSGKHTMGASQKGTRFDGNRLYQGRYWNDTTFERVAALAEVAREEGVDMVTLAHAWVAGRPGVDAILLGPASVEHLDSAIDACQKTLSPAACARIDALSRTWAGTDVTYAR
jgi:aryl-alcohol dehydrogenase-like predicted oxidoreductase